MIALTCPHCENALLIGEQCRAARIRCPQCDGVLPNPDEPADPLDYAHVAQSAEAKARYTQRARLKGIGLLLLAVMGSLEVAFLTSIWIETTSFRFIVAPLFPIACLVATMLTQQGHSGIGIGYLVGWAVLQVFAFIGAAFLVCWFVGTLLTLLDLLARWF